MLEFLDFPKRVKTIYIPEKVEYPGVHLPMKLYPGVTSVAVDISLGFLAHHRRWNKPRCFFDLRILAYYKTYLAALKQSYKQMDTFYIQ